ncbi:MAG: hypothetical protein HYR67_02975 [Bacteroidetes bacterium]|nr:hypothetical protein [Bacteroidota bacterium]
MAQQLEHVRPAPVQEALHVQPAVLQIIIVVAFGANQFHKPTISPFENIEGYLYFHRPGFHLVP